MTKLRNKPDKRITWLDSLRGLACLIVIFAHIVATDSQFGVYANGCGKIGVWLFMLISGMMAERYIVSPGKGLSLTDVVAYYERKFVRIYPALLLALLLAVGLQMISPDSARRVILLQEGPSHLWYIPVLIKFYLAVPLLKMVNWVCHRWFRRPDAVFYGFIAGSAAVLALVFPYTKYVENSIALYWYMPVFLTGVLVAPIVFKRRRNRLGAADLATIVGTLLILMETPLGRQFFWNIPPSSYLQNKYLYIGGCWVLILLGATYGRKTKTVLKRCRMLQICARFSYEIYLFHFALLLWLWQRFPWAIWLRGIASILGACILAVIVNKALDLLSKKVSLHVRTGMWAVLCVGLVVCL